MARTIVAFREKVARGQKALELLAAAHEARRYEKAERRKMADALVDLAIENARLRHLIADMAPYLHTAASRSDSLSPPFLLEEARRAGCKTPTIGRGRQEPSGWTGHV